MVSAPRWFCGSLVFNSQQAKVNQRYLKQRTSSTPSNTCHMGECNNTAFVGCQLLQSVTAG